MSIRSILCPVDLSPTSENTARFAVDLGLLLGAARVRLLHVVQPVSSAEPRVDYLLDTREGADPPCPGSDRLLLLARRLGRPGIQVEASWAEGVAATEIVEHAAEHEFDLVVMSTHARGGVSRFLLGSIASHVLRAGTVPVCTVGPADVRVLASRTG